MVPFDVNSNWLANLEQGTRGQWFRNWEPYCELLQGDDSVNLYALQNGVEERVVYVIRNYTTTDK